jgi:hypothetical protein
MYKGINNRGVVFLGRSFLVAVGISLMTMGVAVAATPAVSTTLLRELTISSGEPRSPREGEHVTIAVNEGKIVRPEGEPAYGTLGVGWGIQWHFDPAEFLSGVAYDVFVEYYVPKATAQKANSLVFQLYNFGQKDPEISPAGIRLERKAIKPDTWQVAKVCRSTLANQNGYVYVDMSPRELIDVNKDPVRVRRFWAVPVVESDAQKAAMLSACREAKIAAGKKQQFLDNYRVTRFRNAEQIFHYGIFFGPGGVEVGSKWFGLSYEDYMRIVLRSARDRGFNAFTHCMTSRPDHLKSMLDLAERHDMWVIAGSPGKPLNDRYTTRDSIEKLDWGAVRKSIKAMTDVGAGHPNLLAYYLSDESKEFMEIPLLKAIKIFEEYDPSTPALANGPDQKYLPISMQTLGYPYTKTHAQVRGLPETSAWFDWKRQQGAFAGTFWGILQAYGNKDPKIGRRMPTPAEMEGQIFAGLAARLTGMAFYMYYQTPSWTFQEVDLVDAYMNPQPAAALTLARMSRIAGELRGVGELLARGDYLENWQDRVKVEIPEFETYYEARGTRQTHPQAKVGLYRLPDYLGYAAVFVNQQVDHDLKLPVQIAPVAGKKTPLMVADLLKLEELGPATDESGKPKSLQLQFTPGAGKVLWFGDAKQWQAVRDEILLTRALWNCRQLQEEVRVASHYLPPEQLPNLSFVTDIAFGVGRTETPGATLSARYKAAKNAFDAICAADNAYSRATNELKRMREALGKAEAAMPFEKANYRTKFEEFSPRGQAMLAAGGRYLKLLLKHWDAGVSPEELAGVAAAVKEFCATPQP